MRYVMGIACVVVAAGCGHEPAEAPAASAAGPSIERRVEKGPLVATVSLSPDKPRVGDVLKLTLTVEAQPGAQVAMPPFGEALGRFDVVGFVPREESTAGGGRRFVQDYRLQASRSGRLRVPPLRVEYSVPGAARDAGPAAAEELLTEEIPVEIESVLTAEGAGTLGAARGALDETLARTWLLPALIGGGLVGVTLAFLGVARMRRRRSVTAQRSATEVALGRLAALAGRGLPSDRLAADPWYVELSDIVRRYLEDRFGVRAPELTTEEFLREVRVMGGLREEHRALVAAFLEGCDRVKFAGHAPGESESRLAIEAAERLVLETGSRSAPDPVSVSGSGSGSDSGSGSGSGPGPDLEAVAS